MVCKNGPKSLTLPCVHTQGWLESSSNQELESSLLFLHPGANGRGTRGTRWLWRHIRLRRGKSKIEFWQQTWSCLGMGKFMVRVRVEIISITWLENLGLLLSCFFNRMWKKRGGSSSELSPPNTEFSALPVAPLHLSERGDWDNTWNQIWVV